MTPELEPLSADTRAILEAAEVPHPPADVESRVFSRLRAELTVPVPAVPGGLGSLGAPLAVASLIVGLVVGSLLHARFAQPVIVTEVRTVEVPAALIAVAPVPLQRPVPRAVAPRPAPEPAGRDLALAEERSLIERARSALVRGEPRLAIEALSKHADSFPRGRLAEERESLLVQALVNAGEFAAARTRAKNFATTFPESLLAPAVEAVVRSIPP